MDKKILIVVDSEQDREMEEGLLKRAGYEISSATNGDEAMRKAQSFSPDLILMDHRMAGIPQDLAELSIRAKNRSIPIIALIASGDSPTVMSMRTMGFTDHLMKPFEPRDLFSKIEKALAVPPP